MNFNTYIKEQKRYDIQKIKEGLIRKVEKAELLSACKKEIIEALGRSGGNGFASRYGLNEGITFADSELLSAYDRKEDSINYLKYRYDFKYYPSNHVLRKFPLVVAVEASGCCNLRCGMCFQKTMDQNGYEKNKQIMSWDTYQKFLDELDHEVLYSIVFASRGEPLLNPNITKMICAAKAKGVLDIKLNSNATLLTEEKSREILSSGLDLMVFSVDSVVPDNYFKIRGFSLQRVLNNINRFVEIKRKEFSDSKMKVRIAMVLTNELKEVRDEEIRIAQEYWDGRVDELSIKTENDFLTVYEDGEREFKRQVCSLLWERVYLWSDGTVNPCDIDYLSSMSIGNINEGSTIKELWNGEKMQKLRKMHLCDRDDMDTICKNCIGY